MYKHQTQLIPFVIKKPRILHSWN